MNKSNPREVMLEAMVCGTSAAIQASEARGQSDLCSQGEACQLPTKGVQELKRMGVVVKEQVQGDDLFTNTVLPKGWKIASTDHSMWSHLVDDKGRVRAKMFYKAAFYDRGAHIHPCNRLSATYHSDDYGDQESPYYPAIQDSNGTVVWRGKAYSHKEYSKAHDEAEKVLLAVYPDYKDITAYWDVETMNFPTWESQEPKGIMYVLRVSIYRDGHHVDGGDHATCRAESAEEAKTKLLKKVDFLLQSYDRVECEIREQESKKNIHKATLLTQRPKKKEQRRRTMYSNCFGETYEKYDESW